MIPFVGEESFPATSSVSKGAVPSETTVSVSDERAPAAAVDSAAPEIIKRAVTRSDNPLTQKALACRIKIGALSGFVFGKLTTYPSTSVSLVGLYPLTTDRSSFRNI
jgi:hypothetical protein